MTRTAIVLTACLAAGGCSVLAPLPEPGTGSGGAAERAPREAPEAPDAPDAPGSAATTSLVAVGRSAREAGNYEAATAYFEQALRIAPNDPRLWIELGETKLAQGDTAQAEAMGRKALTLIGEDDALAARARPLVEAN